MGERAVTVKHPKPMAIRKNPTVAEAREVSSRMK
jgi:hypothetical protein